VVQLLGGGWQCCRRLPDLQLSNDPHTAVRRALEHATPPALTHTREHDGTLTERERMALPTVAAFLLDLVSIYSLGLHGPRSPRHARSRCDAPA
jgi:hypothetical protein